MRGLPTHASIRRRHRPRWLIAGPGPTGARKLTGAVVADRRRSGDRRDARDADLLLAELEMRVAAAIRQSGGLIEGDGSGWDKLIVPFR
jgi:hypothetical protein